MAPWSASTFKARHGKKLTDAEAERAAKVANAVLNRDGDEGKAIRVGLAVAERHRFRAGKRKAK